MKRLCVRGPMQIALAAALALVSSPSYAGKIVIGCSLVKKYSEFEVNMLLGQAKSVVGEQEASKLYSKYVGLKTECQANNSASRIVAVSPALGNWLAQNGVDVRKMMVSER